MCVCVCVCVYANKTYSMFQSNSLCFSSSSNSFFFT